jgi:cytochrome c551/c552
MSNTLTTLAPTLFSAAKKVAAEPFGVVGAINTSFDDKGVAKGDNVSVDVAPTRAAADFTPGATTSTGDDSTGAKIDVTITKSRKVSWHLTGEQQRSLANATIDQDWVSQLVQQGMRTLRNECEVDAAVAVKVGASRAYGIAGTAPFATDLTALTNARKILVDNGAPKADLQMVFDTTAGLNLRNLGVLQNAYQAGGDAERRSGEFLPQMGFRLSESAGIGLHTPGTGAGHLINNGAGYSIGSTALTVDTGTGTILPGDVITIAGDANKYVVVSALAANVVTIGAPGLRKAAADNAAFSYTTAYTANLAFERNAVVGVLRPPIMPPNPTIDQMLVSDDKGMTYLMLQIAQYGQLSWELHLAWGFKTINGEFSAIVLG